MLRTVNAYSNFSPFLSYCLCSLYQALLATDPSQDKKSYMKLRWGPISPLVTYLSDPSSYRRKGRFSPKSGMVAIDDGCAITDNCNTDHNSITVDSPCDVSRTGDKCRKNQGVGEGASNVMGGLDVEEFEALDPSEGGSEDNDEFSQIHVGNKSYDDGNASDESKARSEEREQLDIIEDIVSSDVYDTYHNAHVVAVFANKL